ncbi:MAG: UvrD-helicase domain-containing protein [Candidatus Peribacteraceae bacterium]|nr:UvrD-helicase domain-containing protein [Candidatus Peribacteraceae bacterium]
MSSDQSAILTGLNEQQKEAVNTLSGPLLILAGAGSGKTRTLTHRIANLMANGIPPWQILAVTFTNKAAAEMKERISRILHIVTGEELPSSIIGSGSGGGKLPVSGTFHSLCTRILRRDIEHIGRNRSFVIYDKDDQEKVMKEVLRDMNIAPEELKPRTALAIMGQYKCEAIGPAEARTKATGATELRTAGIYTAYQKKLLESNALDFDDLITEAVRLFTECPEILKRYQHTWRYLHVDEYQDTNRAQYLFISLLAKEHRNLCVIGDPDQSIYAFRGADIRNILDFTNEYPNARSIKLERNYRSTQEILDAADGVIAANPNRPQKKMWTDRKSGIKVDLKEVIDERREAEEAIRMAIAKRTAGVPLREQVILYRTNAQSRLFEESCLRAGIPYRILGGLKFYARKEVKDILAYLHAILNQEDVVSLLRIVNVPPRKIGDTTLGRLRNFCAERTLTLWQAMKHIPMVEGISEGAKNRIGDFTALLEQGKIRAQSAVVSNLTEWIIKKTGMEKYVRDGTEEGEERWENILELLSVTKKYDNLPASESLVSFLEEVALVSEVDKLIDSGKDALTLMTLHLCKGLEFSSVMIVGCEEGLLPHGSSNLDRAQMEEERRLLYVGMTRAKDTLTLLHAMSRSRWGDTQSNPRSRFLDDIPSEVINPLSDILESKYSWLSAPRSSSESGGQAPTRSHTTSAINEFNQDTENDWLQHNEEEITDGMRILHRSLGQGTVLRRSGDIIEVRFDSGSTKKLAIGIAPIRILKEISGDLPF